MALLSRVGLDDVLRALPDAPAYSGTVEARAVTATCGGLRVTSVYVPNGRTPDDPHYAYKLEWLAALRESVTAPATSVVAGDMNIAPTDADVWDPALFTESTHVTPPSGRRWPNCRAPGCTTCCASVGPASASSPTGTTGRAGSTRTRACGSTWCSRVPTRQGASPPRGWTGRRGKGRGRATTRR